MEADGPPMHRTFQPYLQAFTENVLSGPDDEFDTWQPFVSGSQMEADGPAMYRTFQRYLQAFTENVPGGPDDQFDTRFRI